MAGLPAGRAAAGRRCLRPVPPGQPPASITSAQTGFPRSQQLTELITTAPAAHGTGSEAAREPGRFLLHGSQELLSPLPLCCVGQGPACQQHQQLSRIRPSAAGVNNPTGTGQVKPIFNQHKRSVANPSRREPAWSRVAGRSVCCFAAAASRLRAAVCRGCASPTAPRRDAGERQEHRAGRGLLSWCLELWNPHCPVF